MEKSDVRMVEINGVKMEIDMRTARKVDAYRVGDRVKVLVKKYETYTSCFGVIVAFDEFTALPSITVCYIESGYSNELKFATLNKETKDVEIAPCNDDVLPEKSEVIDNIDRKIVTKLAEIHDLKSKKAYFEKSFGKWFKPLEEAKTEV